MTQKQRSCSRLSRLSEVTRRTSPRLDQSLSSASDNPGHPRSRILKTRLEEDVLIPSLLSKLSTILAFFCCAQNECARLSASILWCQGRVRVQSARTKDSDAKMSARSRTTSNSSSAAVRLLAYALVRPKGHPDQRSLRHAPSTPGTTRDNILPGIASG